MQMKRNDLKEAPACKFSLTEMLNNARHEGMRFVADKCSSRLDRLAAEAANNRMTATEIVELLRQESEFLNSQGGAAWN
ncbi:DUF2732 family protein [Yersinia rochesterensis]|uniref:DUF2732 family protein n=1 Tax=Yersinia rochesterensis TaxID=1604335 RepID=UPI0028533883|nr:DUF2732 family protein [Yersinia rochesterensis]MDR5018459.1 DUF2732 family protein [Yersinia rochesterensis]